MKSIIIILVIMLAYTSLLYATTTYYSPSSAISMPDALPQSNTLTSDFDFTTSAYTHTPPKYRKADAFKSSKKGYEAMLKEQEQYMRKSYNAYMKRKKGTWLQRLITKLYW